MVSIVTGNGLGVQTSSERMGATGHVGEASFGQTGERIYVNAATGNLIIEDQDQLLIGRGVNGAVNRAYNSLGQIAGDNWQPGGTRSVGGLTGTLNTAGSTVTRTDWDGTTVVYQYDAAKLCYVSTDGAAAYIADYAAGQPAMLDVSIAARSTLTFDSASNAWKWNDAQGALTETYDAAKAGRLIAARDVDGNTVTYTYSAAGLLSQVTTDSGDVTNLDYNASGQLTALGTVSRNASGQLVTSTAVRYAYDTQGRLSQVIVDLSPDDNSIADGQTFTTTYTYDGSSSRISTITQSDGAKLAFTYLLVDGQYRVSTIAETGDAGAVRVTTLTYDTWAKKTTVTNPLGYKTSLAYDAAGRLLVLDDYAGRYATFTYSEKGDLTYFEDHIKGVRLSYDADGKCTNVGLNNSEVVRTYDENNHILTESVHDNKHRDNGFGVAGLFTTRYAYDAHGHLRYEVGSGGNITEYRYNAAGQLVAKIEYTGSMYDVSGLDEKTAISMAMLDSWVANCPDPSAAIRTDTSYDYRGNIASVTRYAKLRADGTGDLTNDVSVTRYVYDPFGRLLQRYVGATGDEHCEQFAYDGLGRLLASTNFDGARTTYQYDSAQHTVAITFANGLTRISAYDAAGELIAVTDTRAGQVLSQVRNAYDVNGRLRMTTDANGGVTHYLYNARGQCTAQIVPDGTLTEYVWSNYFTWVDKTITYATRLTSAQMAMLTDAQGRPVEFKESSPFTIDFWGFRPPTSAADRAVWYFYEGWNYLDHTVDSDGVVTRTLFDSFGRPEKTIVFANRLNFNGNPPSELPAPNADKDHATRYFYGQNGQLVGELDALGYLTEYRYNGAGERIETIRYANATNASQRATGTLAQLIPGGNAQDVHTRYMYDARGWLIAEVDGEGYMTRYRYDATGNVIERTRGARIDLGAATAPQQVQVSFRSALMGSSQPASVEVWIDGVMAGTATVSSSGQDYAFTASNYVSLANHTVELRWPKGASISVSELTVNGRLQTQTGSPVWDNGGTDKVAVQFELDVASALDSAVLPGEFERTTYLYDAMGRLVDTTSYSVGADANARYAYDAMGHLVSETHGNRTSTYRYDEQGRLTAQLSGEGSAALAALGANPSQSQADAVWDAWGVRYGYDAAGLRTSMTDANGHKTLYYYDTAGHLTHVVNAAGEVVENQYDTLGDMTATIVYATRLTAPVLASLAGGSLTAALAQTFIALGNDGEASRTTFSYSTTGRLLKRTDALGASTDYKYDAFGALVSKTQDLAAGVRTTTTYDYDSVGQQIRQVSDAGGLNLITQAIYDAFGRVTQSVDATGVVRQQAYDRNGNVVVLTDGVGSRTKLTYDAFGNVLTRTDRTGHTTKYEYSAFNRKVSVTTPEGIRTVTSYNESGQIIGITDGRGNTTSYTYDLDGNLIQTQNRLATTKQTFDHAGHLIQTTDARGVKTAFSYDAVGRVLTRTVDPGGLALVTRYEYDAKGALVRTTDPSGMVTQTQYDLDGQAVSVTTDASGLKLRTEFAYDSAGRVVTITEGAGTASSKVTQKTYDNLGRLVSSTLDPAGLKLTTKYAYDANGNVIAVTDAAGGVTHYAYDAEGRQIWSVDPMGAAVQSVYDAEGWLISQQRFAKTISLSGLPLAASAEQIAARVTTWTQRDELTRYAYDADGRLRFALDALGYVTEQTYDANGNVISRTAYSTAVALSGSPDAVALSSALQTQTSAMHANDRITRTVYDAANRPVFSINALGYVTQNRYDANGNVVGQTVYATAWTGTGNPTESQLATWLASPGVARADQDRSTTWILDNAGRAAYVVDSEGYVTANRYDAAGHLVQTVRYASRYENLRTASYAQAPGQLPSTPPADAVVTKYGYDSVGRLTDVTNALGFVTHYVLDAQGRAIDTTVAYGSDQQSVTHAVYDAAGNLIEQTRAWGTQIASTTRYTFDGMGRVLTTIDPRGVELAERDTAAALAERKRLGYVDSSGNGLSAAALTQQQRAELLARYTSRNTFDADGQLIESDDALGNRTRYQYDAFGNRVAEINPVLGKATFFYDKLNRLIAQVSPNYSVVKTDYDAFGEPVQVTHYAEYKSGETGGVWYSDGWTYELSQFLPASNPSDAITRLEYDRMGQLIKSTDAEGYAEKYTYDAFGNRTGYTNKLGGAFTYTYDRRGLKLSETLPVNNEAGRLATTTYEYDARGNLITLVENAKLDLQDWQVGERRTDYVYDLADRVVSKTNPGTYFTLYVPTVERYDYDARGNLTVKTDPNGNKTTWYYDAANQRAGEVNALGGLTLWTFDAAGNIVSTRIYADPVTPTSGSQPPAPVNAANVRETRVTYDADNHMIESRVMNVANGYFDPTVGEDQRGAYFITSGSDLVTKYEYSALGLVVAKIDPEGNRTMYFYNGTGQLVGQVDAKGYGIAWTLNAQGDVSQEIQFALPYPDPISSSATPVGTLPSDWPRSGDDRITNYTYDRLGRKTSESRLNVQYAKVDTNGKLQQLTGDATTRYTYDGNGDLLRKVDANGSQYDYTYDALGRQTSQILPQFADYQGRLVRSTTTFIYDGLNRVRVEQISAGDGSPAQEFKYNYWGGYGLYYITSNNGYASTYFGYDAAGNMTSSSTGFVDAGGEMWEHLTQIGYDKLNREVSRIEKSRNWVNSYLVLPGMQLELKYNAFGELTGKRTNGGGLGGSWQEYADYDNAGRVVRTNFGDGISHLFMYDRNGNATLKVESMNTDLRGVKVDTGEDLKTLLQNIDMMQTYTRYDERNQVIQIRQPKTSGGVPYIFFSPVDIPIDGGEFANTQLSIAGWLEPSGRPVTEPAKQVEAQLSFPMETKAASVNVALDGWVGGVGVSYLEKIEIGGIPDLTSYYGDYEIQAIVRVRAYGLDNKLKNDSGTVTVSGRAASTLDVLLDWRQPKNQFFLRMEYEVELVVSPLSGGEKQTLGKLSRNPIFNLDTHAIPEATSDLNLSTMPHGVLNLNLPKQGTDNVVTATAVVSADRSSLSISLSSDLTGTFGAYQLSVAFYGRLIGAYSADGTKQQSDYYQDIEYITSEVNGTQISIPLAKLSQYIGYSFTADIVAVPMNGPERHVPLGTISIANLFTNNPFALEELSYMGVKKEDLGASKTLSIGTVGSNFSVAQDTFAHAQGAVYCRPAGSTANFQILPAIDQSNGYAVNLANLPSGDYEMIFMAVSDGGDGPAGTLLRRDGYRVHIPPSGSPSVTDDEIPQKLASERAGFTVGALGSYLWSAPQVLNLYSLQSNENKLADHLDVHIRKAGDAGWRIDVPVYRNPVTGAFTLDMSAYGADTYALDIDLYDANGVKIDALRGALELHGGDASPSFVLGYLADFKSSVVFHTQPADTDYMVVSWLQDGTTKYATVRKTGGDFIWDTTQCGLQSGTRYSIKFTSYDPWGMPLCMGQGDITIGENASATLTGSTRPSIMQFTPTDNKGVELSNVETLTLMYRKSTQKDNDYNREFTTVTLTRDAAGRFLFDAGSLPTNAEYEYRYLAKDASGNVVMERQ
ncbi:RHS repeat protein, partial [Caballeronia pedi]|uniref:RHS repeat protein n=1 Tax=Caballeronia pedi TaxID=1777141 RepID=UPI000A9F3A99